MALDAKSWKRTDQAILAGAAVAFIAGFLPWYGYTGSISILRNASISGWSSGFWAWAGVLLLTLAGVFLFLRLAETTMPDLPIAPGMVVVGLSGLGLLFVIIRWLTFPSVPGLAVGAKWGIWVALIAGLVETVAAVMQVRESGEPLPWAQSSATAAPAADAPAAEPPAPESSAPASPESPPADG
jgi:hypothetical protein